jgi:hypothetical protein
LTGKSPCRNSCRSLSPSALGAILVRSARTSGDLPLNPSSFFLIFPTVFSPPRVEGGPWRCRKMVLPNADFFPFFFRSYPVISNVCGKNIVAAEWYVYLLLPNVDVNQLAIAYIQSIYISPMSEPSETFCYFPWGLYTFRLRSCICK